VEGEEEKIDIQKEQTEESGIITGENEAPLPTSYQTAEEIDKSLSWINSDGVFDKLYSPEL
jgi:hypothetical protein